jgi:hypothetical protein
MPECEAVGTRVLGFDFGDRGRLSIFGLLDTFVQALAAVAPNCLAACVALVVEVVYLSGTVNVVTRSGRPGLIVLQLLLGACAMMLGDCERKKSFALLLIMPRTQMSVGCNDHSSEWYLAEGAGR